MIKNSSDDLTHFPQLTDEIFKFHEIHSSSNLLIDSMYIFICTSVWEIVDVHRSIVNIAIVNDCCGRVQTHVYTTTAENRRFRRLIRCFSDLVILPTATIDKLNVLCVA